MKIRRTANAGVLLELDGVTFLLDGVCKEVSPYLATPPEERKRLSQCYSDVLAFTHTHKDHYDPAFAAEYQKRTDGAILGCGFLSGDSAVAVPITVRGVTITPIRTRHIGSAGNDTQHVSFVIEGSKCVWFLGDASPSQMRLLGACRRPDTLIVPYAYASTPSAFSIVRSIAPENIVILHMPLRENDPNYLWSLVENTVAGVIAPRVFIPDMGQTLEFS